MNKTNKKNSLLRKAGNKLRSKRGESIIEVMVAIVIGLFSVLMLGEVISTSAKLDRESRETMSQYYASNNQLASAFADNSAAGQAGLVRIKGTGDDNTEIKVDVQYFVNDKIGTNKVAAYRVITGNAGGEGEQPEGNQPQKPGSDSENPPTGELENDQNK